MKLSFDDANDFLTFRELCRCVQICRYQAPPWSPYPDVDPSLCWPYVCREYPYPDNDLNDEGRIQRLSENQQQQEKKSKKALSHNKNKTL